MYDKSLVQSILKQIDDALEIDAEQVFWICEKELLPLSITVKKIIKTL